MHTLVRFKGSFTLSTYALQHGSALWNLFDNVVIEDCLTRFAGADEWLTQNRQAQPAPAATRDQFEQFLAGKRASGANIGTDSSPEREQLFQQFLQWQSRQT